MSEISGLTSSQVQERRQSGQSNKIKLTSSRSGRDIVLKNAFSPVNIVLYAIGLGMMLVGDFKSALVTVLAVVINAVVGIIQESRVKNKLDQIALLARAKTSVIRDGQEQMVEPSELVSSDVLVIRAGDQLPVDGLVEGDGKIEVDESAITGEADLVSKVAGDKVLSGTFCITGKACIEATGVGEQSFANRLTQNARQFRLEVTPFQRNLHRLLRVILLIVAFFSFLAVLALFVLDLPPAIWLQILAVITGSVSASLLTLITLNSSWGAMRIGQKGGLVQQNNAVESLSNVTVLCTDKTGTLTANRIQYHDSFPVGVGKAELESLLADFAASASAVNKTSEAILLGLPGSARPVADEVPFSSARKWSAIAFEDSGSVSGVPSGGAYVLGALEMLRQDLTAIDQAVLQQLEQWSLKGLRVLVFARNLDMATLHNASGEPDLPQLTLLGLVSFSDELRPHLRETIAAFTDNGVRLKVISGDNPQTVAALARQAGLPGDLRAISGPELAQMNPADFAQAAVESTVFGRITPQQKEALVEALRSRGEYVAMMGDGVNDVLSLKKANVGIAMQSGSTATRSVAAMILMGDSFEVMPQAFSEGQRIVNSNQEILKLFMSTVFALLLLIIGVSLLSIGFPLTTLQNFLLAIFARVAPALVLAMVVSAGRQHGNLMKHLSQFTLPASFTIFLFGLLIYISAYFAIDQRLVQIEIPQEAMIRIGELIGRDYGQLTVDQFQEVIRVTSAQTALTTFIVFAGVLLLVFAQPPLRWLAGGSEYNGGKWMPTIVAAILVLAYGFILTLPQTRYYFGLAPLPASLLMFIVVMTFLWAVTQLAVWRSHLLDRFLDAQVYED